MKASRARGSHSPVVDRGGTWCLLRVVLSPAPPVAGRCFEAPRRGERLPCNPSKHGPFLLLPHPLRALLLFLTEPDFAVSVTSLFPNFGASLSSLFSVRLLFAGMAAAISPKITDSLFHHVGSYLAPGVKRHSAVRVSVQIPLVLSLSLHHALALSPLLHHCSVSFRAPPLPRLASQENINTASRLPPPHPPTLTHPGTETLSSRFPLSLSLSLFFLALSL